MNEIVILNNKKCVIKSEDTDLLKKLKNFLSFKMTGAEYSPAYQNGWNGITYLLTKTNKFDLGLLSKVESFLTEKGFEYQVTDTRAPVQFNEPLDISDNLKKHGFIPRDYQLKMLDVAMKNNKGIVRACTGAGKTLTIAMITAQLNKPTMIYVIGLDLLDQFYKLFSKLFNEKIGYIGNGTVDIARINIASIWTVGKALKIDNPITDAEELNDGEVFVESNRDKIVNALKESKVSFFDESHVCTTNTISTIYKNINPEHIYGFSGTPFRDDGSDLLINGILGEQIINVSASELIDKGVLAKPLIKFVSVPKMSCSGQYLSVYKDYIVENEIRNNLIIENTKSLIDKKYTPLVLFKQIKHGEIIYQKLLDAGISCAILHGNDDLERRQEVKDQLVNSEIQAIVASTIFDIGLDLPQLSGLVLCGGGKSTIRCLQRVGRVLRMVPGKKFAAVIDFYDQVKFLKKHAQIRHATYASEPGFKVIKSREMK
jgi:superfamily II DNA or RNA helicase